MYTKLKSALRNSKLVLLIYQKFFYVLFSLHPILPMKFPIMLMYRISFGRKLDLKNPIGLNEKIQWLKTYYRDPLLVKCTDKYMVREFVENMKCGNTLNELFGVYDKFDDIKFDEMPDKFVIKATHGCGTNLICDDPSKLDIRSAKLIVDKWMRTKIGKSTGELHYSNIKPRIIVEKYIGQDDGTLPIDYKIFCFNGIPYCIAVYSDRDRITLQTKRCFFNFQWEALDIVTEKYVTDPSRFKRPSTLDYMYEVAKKLSAPFPFVRVDLYEYNGKVIFGELTFTPTGGYIKAITNTANIEFGMLLTLPEKSEYKSYKI